MQFSSKKNILIGNITFLNLGIAALIGWNAVLTSLDFFQDQFKDYKVYFYLPIPVFISTNLFGFLMLHISKIFSTNCRIIVAIVISSLLMILFPISANFLEQKTGFWICMFLSFILGASTVFIQSSSIAYACTFYQNNFLEYFTTGTGLAGLIICIFRFICLGVFGTSQQNALIGCLVYFLIAVVIQIISVISFLIFQTMCLKDEKAQALLKVDKQSNEINHDIERSVNYNKNDSQDKQSTLEVFQYLFKVGKNIMPMPLLLFIVYIQTFMIWPGLGLKKHIDGMQLSYGTTLLVLVHNIFDTFSKYIAQYRIYNVAKISVLILLRNVFFVTFILILTMNNSFLDSNVFIFINMALFSFTNGYATCALYVLAPQKAQSQEDKSTSGFIMAFPLNFGIFVGSFLALTLSNIGGN